MTVAVSAQYSAADQLSDVARQIRDVETKFRTLGMGLSERQFRYRPEDGSWSIAQCLEHLELTGHAFLPLWDAAIERARGYKEAGEEAYLPNWFERWMLRQMEPPYKRKSKTARAFEPEAVRSKRLVLDSFADMHDQVARRLRQAEGVDLGAVKVPSPFMSWVKYPLGFSFLLFAAHERRHLWQASQVRVQVPPSSDTTVTSF